MNDDDDDDDDDDDNEEDNNRDHISKNFLLNPNLKSIVLIAELMLLVGHQMTKLQNEPTS